MKKIFLAAALAALSTSALAGGFDGPFVQASLGWAKTETKMTDGADTTKWHDSATIGKLSAGYGYSFGGFHLSGNVFYVVGDLKSGSLLLEDGTTVKTKGSNTYGVSIEPGWNVTESTLAYAKLSYVHTTGKVSADGIDPISVSRGLNGFGYGVGVKQKLSQSLYGLAEIEQIDFGSTTVEGVKLKPSTFGAYVGVGYKF